MLLRAQMSHFATNLQYYLMFEVLEAARQVNCMHCVCTLFV